MELRLILEHGLIYSLLLSVNLALLMLVSPRLMLHNYPKEIRRAVISKTKKEQQQTITYGMVTILTFVLYPFFIGLSYATHLKLTFRDILLFVWGVTMFFNLWDLLILDWLVRCTLQPKFLEIPGTGWNKGYKNYSFHIGGFLIGTLVTLLLSVLESVLIKFVFMPPIMAPIIID